MKSLTKEKRYDLIDAFNSTSRYLDDLLYDKIMFDRYYCINSANHCENEENIWRTIFYNLITFSYASTLLKPCMIRAQFRYS